MKFTLSQRLFMPNGMGYDGVQCVVTGRAEYVDKEPDYWVKWLDAHGEMILCKFEEGKLAASQPDAGPTPVRAETVQGVDAPLTRREARAIKKFLKKTRKRKSKVKRKRTRSRR